MKTRIESTAGTSPSVTYSRFARASKGSTASLPYPIPSSSLSGVEQFEALDRKCGGKNWTRRRCLLDESRERAGARSYHDFAGQGTRGFPGHIAA
jgi:hypothetical protein